MHRPTHKKLRRIPEAERDGDHWLGDGVSGLDTVFFELDPYHYVADQTVCRQIRNWVFSHQREREKATALLVLSGDQLGYQLGFLAEYFDLYIWADEYSELRETAAERYRAKIILGPLPDSMIGEFDLVMFSGLNIFDIAALRNNVQQMEQVVSERGFIMAVFPARVGNNGLELSLISETLSVESVRAGEVFLFSKPTSVESIAFDTLPAQEEAYMRDFLRRHSDFFGKGATGPFLQYLRDPEMSDILIGADARLRYSSIVIWGEQELFGESDARAPQG